VASFTGVVVFYVLAALCSFFPEMVFMAHSFFLEMVF
jgi:hypothetical protein